MNFCFSEMVAAFCDKTLPLQRRARRLGEWDRPGLRGWQPRSLAPSANRPSSGIRSARIRVSAGYSSTRVQLSSGQHFHSCLSLTDFSNSELLKILKFPFMRSVHNMTPPFFFTHTFLRCWNSDFSHLTWSSHIFLVLFRKAWFLLMCRAIAKKARFLFLGLPLFPA